MFCKVCGKELSNTAAFCTNCGSKVATQNAAEELVEEAISELNEETVAEQQEAFAERVAEEAEEIVNSAENLTEDMKSETEVVAEVKVEDVKEIIAEQTEDIEHESVPVIPVPVVPVVTEEDKKQIKADAKAAKAEVKAEKAGIKAAKAEAKAAEAAAKAERLRYMVKRNKVMSSITCVLLAVITTAVMFMTTSIALLCNAKFDDFYYGFITENRVDYDAFWIMTSVWYLYIMAAVLVLLVLLMLSVLKRRKYAIFNYVGIPMIVNGVFFALVALLNKWIAKTFELSELFEELFDVISDEAKNLVLFAGVILLAAGALFVLIYVLVSVIHKAVYRRKCMKAENN